MSSYEQHMCKETQYHIAPNFHGTCIFMNFVINLYSRIGGHKMAYIAYLLKKRTGATLNHENFKRSQFFIKKMYFNANLKRFMKF